MYGGTERPNESIYKIIPPKVVRPEKPPMHKSKHHGKVPPTASTFHQIGTTLPAVSNLRGLEEKPVEDLSARSMGMPPGSARNDPCKFMKSLTKNPKVLSLAEVRRTSPDQLKPTCMTERLKPVVPRCDERPVCNLVSSKNFIVANAVENILASPRRVPTVRKDYIHKEDYGQVPQYLEHVKRDIAEELNYIRELQQKREDAVKSLVRPLTESERDSLIEGLKCKWEHVNTEYQATTHLTKLDTIGKTKRKESYEAQLSQIEKDIEKLNRKNIMVNSTM